MSEFVTVGRIVGTHGLRGELKVEPLTDFPTRFDKGSRLRIDDEWIEVKTCRWHKGRPLLVIEGIDSIDKAEALKWKYLIGLAEDLKLQEGEFLSEDLVGLAVLDESGAELGIVDEILRLPAHDVIAVGNLLIPAVEEFVLAIDLEQGTLTVRLIEGMLEEAELE